MNGLGNDFVVLDGRSRAISMDDARARAIANRKTGIGCDQIIMLEKSDIADVRMLVWNSGGGQVESCGNASRCIADMLFDENKTTSATIDTLGGFLVARKAGDRVVTIDNGVPRFDWKDIPLSEPFHDTRHIELQVGPIDAPLIHSPSVVNVGNPHCIFWVDDLDVVDLSKVGPDAGASSPVSGAGEYFAGARRCAGSRDAEGLGAQCRPHQGLRHGGLRHDGGGGADQDH